MKPKFHKLFIIFILLSASKSGAQNLVFNSTFTDMDTSCTWYSGNSYEVSNAFQNIRCMAVWGQLSDCGIWARPDIARKGNMFASIVLYNYFGNNERSYLQGKLCSPLENGREYYFSMHLRLKEDARFATSSLGVAFLHNAIDLRGNKEVVDMNPYLLNPRKKLLAKKDGWMVVEGSFVAKGGEAFLLIGNFNNDRNSRVKRVGKRDDNGIVEVFIDDLKLFNEADTLDCTDMKRLPPPPPPIEEEVPPVVELQYIEGKTYIIRDLEFRERSKLSGSYPQLDSLAMFLKENIEFDVEIRGHTDNTLDRQSSFSNSLEKALSVKYYLMGEGIGSQRIKTNGLGYSTPLETNETAEGRQVNNRIDFLIKKSPSPSR